MGEWRPWRWWRRWRRRRWWWIMNHDGGCHHFNFHCYRIFLSLCCWGISRWSPGLNSSMTRSRTVTLPWRVAGAQPMVGRPSAHCVLVWWWMLGMRIEYQTNGLTWGLLTTNNQYYIYNYIYIFNYKYIVIYIYSHGWLTFTNHLFSVAICLLFRSGSHSPSRGSQGSTGRWGGLGDVEMAKKMWTI